MTEPYMIALLHLERHETQLDKNRIAQISMADVDTIEDWVIEADTQDTAAILKALADYVVLSQTVRNHLPDHA